MANINRDYLVIADLKSGKITNPTMSFYNTDKNIANLFVKLQITMSNNPNITGFVNKEEASNYNVKLTVIKPKTTMLVELEGVIQDSDVVGNGAVYLFDMPQNFTDQVGKYICELEVTCMVNGREEIVTCDPFRYTVKESAVTGLNIEIESDPDAPVLKQLIDEVRYLQENGGSIVNLSKYQKMEDSKLNTNDKTIVGGINELGSQIKEKAKQTDLEVERARIDSFTSLKEGSTTGDAELLDARIGADTIKYNNVGTGIRTQFNYINNKIADNLKSSKNLFNKNSSEITYGSYITGNNGNIGTGTASKHAISHLIEVTPGEKYVFKTLYSTFGNNAVRLHWHDSSKTFTLNTTLAVLSDDQTFCTITVPDGVKYVQFNVAVAIIDSIMFVKNETLPSDYEGYYKYLDNAFIFNSTQKQFINDLINSKNLLNGRILTCNGDSIMYGAGHIGGFAKIIAERNNMIYENIAVGGGTIAAETYKQDGSARHWISRTIANMRSDADYIILEGGVNDASTNVPMGEITSNFVSELDDTTFCGAFESILKQVLEKYPGKKIGYVIVHKMTKNYDSRYDNNYYQIAKKICEKWGVPYIDLNVECPPLNYIDSLKRTYTKDADGWHPNEEGYRKFYVDKIEAWMKTL